MVASTTTFRLGRAVGHGGLRGVICAARRGRMMRVRAMVGGRLARYGWRFLSALFSFLPALSRSWRWSTIRNGPPRPAKVRRSGAGDRRHLACARSTDHGNPAPFAVLVGAMISCVNLSRRLELVIARAAGVSAWQFITPALLVAFFFGAVATTVSQSGSPPISRSSRSGSRSNMAAVSADRTAGHRLRLLGAPEERDGPVHHQCRDQQ
ncbi:MAG: LptF/LptG family permease [Xanthobacteraceae bacterium]